MKNFFGWILILGLVAMAIAYPIQACAVGILFLCLWKVTR